MNGKGKRLKGSGFERECAALIFEWLGIETKRKLGQAREGGNDLDIPVPDGATTYRIECKRCERLTIPAWWKQAEDSCKKPGDIPILMYRQSRQEPMVVMKASDWLALVREVL